MKTRDRVHSLLLLAGLAISCAFRALGQDWVESYNLVWKTPSMDSLDSMPLSGRRGAGANVWVQDGSIWLYLGHSGAFDEQGRLLKLGCLRITPEGMKLGSAGFHQRLDLSTGRIIVQQDKFETKLWFAGETLVIESSSHQAHAIQIAFGTWRDQTRQGIRQDMMGVRGDYTSDHVQWNREGFTWFHRNAEYQQNLAAKAAAQGIPENVILDATSRRVFGGAVIVEGGISAPVESKVQWQYWEGKSWTGRTAERCRHLILARLGAGPDARTEAWGAEARGMLETATRKKAGADELKKWKEFWSRSHVVVNPGSGPHDSGWLIGRNYQLFRYMLACNRDAELPLLFNGGIFATDNKPGRITGNNNDELPISEGGPITPDFRRWMGCYFMSQNQRWQGWPHLANGDPDMIAPSFAFYRNRSAAAAARAKVNGADGVVYPEPLDIWGLCPVAPRRDGLCGAEHLTYHFSMMLEHAWMALQARSTLGISIEIDLPWVSGTALFYDSFYRDQTKKRTGRELGEDGKLVIYPGNGLELSAKATNPVDGVCGLARVTTGLLDLPDISPELRTRLRKIQSNLPALPIGMRDGKRSVLPAQSWESEYNKWEPIEMYAAWPYRFIGITRPETLQLARDTWNTIPADRAKFCKQDYSWMANLANIVALGWRDEAKQRAIYKMANIEAPQARFPAFFGPGHNWLPDLDWGGAGLTGVQEMLLAPEPGPRGKLHLFPGWPAGWDVEFKLHAPGQTIVEATLRRGKIHRLKVIPTSRAQQVVNWLENNSTASQIAR